MPAFVCLRCELVKTLKLTFLSYLFVVDKYCMAPILVSREAPVEYAFLKHNLDLPWIMSYLLVPHLPKLVHWEPRTSVADRWTNKQTSTNEIICRSLHDLGMLLQIIV